MDIASGAAVASERESLEAFLDHYREALVRKVDGVSDDDVRRRLVPSETTIGGLVKHLRWVEMNWFERVLAQRPADELPPVPWTDDDPDADFRVSADETAAGLVAAYERQCEDSRHTAADYPIEHTVPHRRLGAVSLRWIYLHMIEETARHVGHVDILREQADGTVGD